MTDAELDAIEERERVAARALGEACSGRGRGGARKFTLRASIPARPDHDDDLVIGAALSAIPALVAEVRVLKARLAAVGAAVRAPDMWDERVRNALAVLDAALKGS